MSYKFPTTITITIDMKKKGDIGKIIQGVMDAMWDTMNNVNGYHIDCNAVTHEITSMKPIKNK